MNEQGCINYSRIAEAIECLQHNPNEQLTLYENTKNEHLNPSHFQQLFIDWVGVSPEKFMEYISVQNAQRILNNSQPTLFEPANKTGLSGTVRLHDLYVEIEPMTSDEYKNNGEQLTVNFSFNESLFGEVLVASTYKGICYMGFSDDKQIAFSALEKRFPKADFIQQIDDIQKNALQVYTQDWSKINKIKLHVKGTDFQLKVWEALLKIPMGNLTTYGNIAEIIQKPKAARAVGTAIGNNPIAFLIPCHRVIQASGVIGGYMWGTTRKRAIIGWETAKINASDINL